MSEHYEGMGSCKTHGWWEVDGQNECPSCENARLRAEVERLRRGTDEEGLSLSERCCGQVKARLELERDEALAALKPKPDGGHSETMTWQEWAQHFQRERDEALALIKTLEATLNDIPCSGPAGCEALAQVAVLLKCAHGDEQTCGCRTNLPTEARALLDQLRHLEDALSTKEERTQTILAKLERSEAVVEALKYIHRGYHAMNYYGRFPGACVACNALAALEEAKGK